MGNDQSNPAHHHTRRENGFGSLGIGTPPISSAKFDFASKRRPSDAVARVSLTGLATPKLGTPPVQAHPAEPQNQQPRQQRQSAFHSSRPKSSSYISNNSTGAQLLPNRPSLYFGQGEDPPSRSVTPDLRPPLPSHLLQLGPPSRNRRMSVAGAGDEILRREVVRVSASTGSSTHNSSVTSSPRRASKFAGKEETVVMQRKFSKSGVGAENAGDYGAGIAEHLKLTSYQSLMLQQSWARIKASVFATVYKQLSQKNAVAKELLQKISIVESFSSSASKKCCDQKEHIRLLVELFDLTIQNLSAPCKIVQQKCLEIGELHYTVFGKRNESQIWEDFGECLTQAVSKADAVRGKREAFRAWIAIISFLVDSMRAGYIQQFKRKSLSRNMSANHVVVTLATCEEINGSSNSVIQHNSDSPKDCIRQQNWPPSRTPTPTPAAAMAQY